MQTFLNIEKFQRELRERRVAPNGRCDLCGAPLPSVTYNDSRRLCEDCLEDIRLCEEDAERTELAVVPDEKLIEPQDLLD